MSVEAVSVVRAPEGVILKTVPEAAALPSPASCRRSCRRPLDQAPRDGPVRAVEAVQRRHSSSRIHLEDGAEAARCRRHAVVP